MSKLQSRMAAAGTILVAALVLSTGTARADKCTGLRLKAIAKKEYGLLVCQSKVAQKGDPSLEAACDAKVLGKFSASFAKSGACSGVQADCEAIADDCRDKVRAALPDGTAAASKCEANRLKTAGKKAEKKLFCYSKAAKKDAPVDSAVGGCLDKASAKFVKSFDKITGCTGDGQSAAIEALVDGECVGQQVVADGSGTVTALCPTTTTSTTTTTTTASSTTTSTTIPTCGNGVVENGEQCDAPGSSCGGTDVCGSDCTCPCTVDTCPCDFLDPSVCLFPFPNDFFTVADADHRHRPARELRDRRHAEERVARLDRPDRLQPERRLQPRRRPSSPASRASTSRRPARRRSPTSARSLDADAPIVIVNAATLAHHLLFAELDSNAHDRVRRARSSSTRRST